MYTLRDVFTSLNMKIPTEASTFMSEDRFDVRKGPNLKMHLNPYFAEMIKFHIEFPFVKYSLDTIS